MLVKGSMMHHTHFSFQNCTLYAIADPAYAKTTSLYDLVEKAILGGVTMVQFRKKNMENIAGLQEAANIRSLCHRYQIPFILNDFVHLAQILDADGVHLGQSDMSPVIAKKILGPDKIIGVTAHNIAEALKAEKDGASYIGCGSLFPSSTKTDTIPLAHFAFKQICQSVQIPVVAIGGINQNNVAQLQGIPFAGIASAKGILGVSDITNDVKTFKIEIEKIREDALCTQH